jgi:hypothetical protein
LRKKIYSQLVVFREFGGTSKSKDVEMENELEKLVFEVRNEECDSDELIELDEELEQMTLVVRRSE